VDYGSVNRDTSNQNVYRRKFCCSQVKELLIAKYGKWHLVIHTYASREKMIIHS